MKIFGKMIEWRTDKPVGAIIVAKISEGFCGSNHHYEVLFYNEIGHYYYGYDGEEIPYSAIEKWALIEEI